MERIVVAYCVNMDAKTSPRAVGAFGATHTGPMSTLCFLFRSAATRDAAVAASGRKCFGIHTSVVGLKGRRWILICQVTKPGAWQRDIGSDTKVSALARAKGRKAYNSGEEMAAEVAVQGLLHEFSCHSPERTAAVVRLFMAEYVEGMEEGRKADPSSTGLFRRARAAARSEMEMERSMTGRSRLMFSLRARGREARRALAPGADLLSWYVVYLEDKVDEGYRRAESIRLHS